MRCWKGAENVRQCLPTAQPLLVLSLRLVEPEGPPLVRGKGPEGSVRLRRMGRPADVLRRARRNAADRACCSRPNGAISWLPCDSSTRERPERNAGAGLRPLVLRQALRSTSGCAAPPRHSTLAEVSTTLLRKDCYDEIVSSIAIFQPALDVCGAGWDRGLGGGEAGR
jgi:hypothetical protein